MRSFGVLTLVSLATLSIAEPGFLGTRSGGGAAITSTMSSPVGVGSILQVALVLAIVLGAVRWLLPKVVSKLNTRLITNLGGEIRIEDTASFAGGNLYIVKARQKTLLLSVGTAGVTCLADLSDQEAKLEPKPTFAQVLENAKPLSPESLASGVPVNDIDETLQRLERLDRLSNL